MTTAQATGRPTAFGLAVAIIVVWVITGPLFHFSDTWQLVINTGTTIITFLMVFLIQNTQNRDSEAVQVKLDELIRANEARTTPCSTSKTSTRRNSIAFEPTTHTRLARQARRSITQGGVDTDAPQSAK